MVSDSRFIQDPRVLLEAYGKIQRQTDYEIRDENYGWVGRSKPAQPTSDGGNPVVLEPKSNSSKGKSGGRKVKGSLLALGTAAVVSIYTVGYMKTGSSIDDLAAQITITPVTAVPTVTIPSSSSATAPSSGTTTTPAATATPRATATTAAAAKYRDGSYTGTGTSRHGNITATVVVSDGKIVSAAVTNCGTRYPCSDVNPLVSAVVSSQAVPTSHVSGATDSSNAYKTAVSTALQKALA